MIIGAKNKSYYNNIFLILIFTNIIFAIFSSEWWFGPNVMFYVTLIKSLKKITLRKNSLLFECADMYNNTKVYNFPVHEIFLIYRKESGKSSALETLRVYKNNKLKKKFLPIVEGWTKEDIQGFLQVLESKQIKVEYS